MNTRRRILHAIAALCAAGGLGAYAVPTFAQAAPQPITLAGWSKPISEITQILAEPELGHFRHEGLTLNYLPGAGGGDALRNLLSGQADVAFTDPGSFFAALDKGAKLRAIYDIYPQNVFNVVTLEGSPIQSAADLKGKRIGVYSLSSGTRQNLQILLHKAGLNEGDVTIIVTGLLNFAPLMQGQVDATAATDTGLLLAKYRGLKNPGVIKVADYLNYSSDLFVVREEDYQRRKPLLQRFLRAYRASTQWMMGHPDDAARLAVKYAIDGRDPVLNRQIIEARNASSLSAYTDQHGLGALDLVSLQAAADAYYELGLIGHKLDLRDAVATDMLP
ncbi:ABC transporter substrate-binding protein [Pusillimonas sp. TS35]|uniref:ABC transporter substrate-binding protein n=1 Tax=Paracandidimonas lactea TaxID=2895524 RepID=UPI00136AC318|nr:ABC transporter substrate-binding protein [Paracandidimonas lactea]MYN13623.1 ABC transporter substrate-binding protein [Pusillimonas sp. TS35]